MNKILTSSLKDIIEKYIKQFTEADFMQIKFCADGKIFGKKNLIAQFLKGHKLSKPQIKLFYDDYFVIHKMLIEKKIKEFFEFMVEKNFSFLGKLEKLKKSSKFFELLIFQFQRTWDIVGKKN